VFVVPEKWVPGFEVIVSEHILLTALELPNLLTSFWVVWGGGHRELSWNTSEKKAYLGSLPLTSIFSRTCK
jgi:hypothetical protein